MNALRAALLAGLLALAGAVLAQAPAGPAPDSPEAQLFAAIDEAKPLVAEGLVTRRKVDVNARNAERETPLHRAVEKGMLPLAKLLIEAGANLRARSASGETPLHLAAGSGHHECALLLLRMGAQVCVTVTPPPAVACDTGYCDEKVANRDTKVWHLVIENAIE